MDERKNLFCGKEIGNSNGRWIFGSLIVLDEDFVFICPPYKFASSLSCQELIAINSVMVDPSTVRQYTGLKDKNGKRIFEGDIVTGYFASEKIIGFILYGSDAKFFIQRDGLFGIGLNNAEDWVEVIGNIHDNPELLEEGAKAE